MLFFFVCFSSPHGFGLKQKKPSPNGKRLCFFFGWGVVHLDVGTAPMALKARVSNLFDGIWLQEGTENMTEKELPSLKLTFSHIFAPEDGWLEDEISFWDGLFSGAILVSGRVDPCTVGNELLEVENELLNRCKC